MPPTNLICKFGLFYKVTIIPLELPGVVTGIKWTKEGIQYTVRYFYSSEAKTVDLFETEIKERIN